MRKITSNKGKMMTRINEIRTRQWDKDEIALAVRLRFGCCCRFRFVFMCHNPTDKANSSTASWLMETADETGQSD
jgi:hypothetical protein